MNQAPIVLQRLLNAPIKAVWHALTNKDAMQEWYFKLTEFKPEVGFKFKFTGGPEDGVQYLHVCEITEVITEQKLAYSWRYDGYEGISFVSFELAAQDNQTLLTLTHSGIDSFPKENKDFAIHNFNEGWKYIVNTSLANYVEKAAV